MNDNAIPVEDLCDIEAFAHQYPNVETVEGLRWKVRHRERLGLASVFVKPGKRWLISKSRYEAWLATQAGRATA